MNLSINSVSNKPSFGLNLEFPQSNTAKEFLYSGCVLIPESEISEMKCLHDGLKDIAPGVSAVFTDNSSVSFVKRINDFEIPLGTIRIPTKIRKGGARDPHYDIKMLFELLTTEARKVESKMDSIPPGLKLLEHDIYSKSK